MTMFKMIKLPFSAVSGCTWSEPAQSSINTHSEPGRYNCGPEIHVEDQDCCQDMFDMHLCMMNTTHIHWPYYSPPTHMANNHGMYHNHSLRILNSTIYTSFTIIWCLILCPSMYNTSSPNHVVEPCCRSCFYLLFALHDTACISFRNSWMDIAMCNHTMLVIIQYEMLKLRLFGETLSDVLPSVQFHLNYATSSASYSNLHALLSCFISFLSWVSILELACRL